MESIEEYLNDDFAMSYGDGSLSDKLVSFWGMINIFLRFKIGFYTVIRV